MTHTTTLRRELPSSARRFTPTCACGWSDQTSARGTAARRARAHELKHEHEAIAFVCA